MICGSVKLVGLPHRLHDVLFVHYRHGLAELKSRTAVGSGAWHRAELHILQAVQKTPSAIGRNYRAFAAGAACGTVSISLPVKTGAECGTPSGDPPACSTVTA